MKTALVTGAAGFIGSHICEALAGQGAHIICLDNLVAGKMENTRPWWDSSLCTFANADVSDLSAIRHWFAGVDVVFHNAASKCTVCYDDPKKDLLVNALGTLNVCTAAHEAGVKKLIHASTGSASDVKSYYGASKLAGENYVKTFREYHPDFNYTVLRYHHVYGPRQDDSDKGGVIPIFIRHIYQGEPVPIFGDGQQVRHFTHVSDVVHANLWAADNPVTDRRTYNVLSDVTCSIKYLMEILYQEMGGSVYFNMLPEKKGDIRTFSATNDMIKTDGFIFRKDFIEGLQETIRWYCRKWERKAA